MSSRNVSLRDSNLLFIALDFGVSSISEQHHTSRSEVSSDITLWRDGSRSNGAPPPPPHPVHVVLWDYDHGDVIPNFFEHVTTNELIRGSED